MITVSSSNKNTKASDKQILGVTISTPGYFELAKEAARRYRQYSGFDSVILEVDKGDGFEAKFRLVDNFKGKQICFFDADCWAVRDLKLEQFIDYPGVIGVNDPTHVSDCSFVRHDSIALGIKFEEYLNTGFLILNFNDPTVVKAFEDAKINIIRKQELNVRDRTEQSILNYGFRHTKVNILPFKYNFFKPAVDWGHFPYIPRDIVNVHAAGYPLPQKLKQLKKQCAVFEENVNRLSKRVYPCYVNNKNTSRKGFIVSTHDQLALAEEAKRRALKYFDIDCEIVYATSKEHAHELKLSTFLGYENEEVFLIDSDLWITQNYDLPNVEHGQICATRSINEGIVLRCEKYDLVYEKYFCSCLVGAYVDNRFKNVIRNALDFRANANPKSYKDELFFNMAAQRDNYFIVVQPENLNWCSLEHINKDIIGLHAANKSDKHTWLKSALEAYEAIV